jgi:hypothetical protein
MAIIQFSVGDMLVMKKKHPCGTDRFKVMRVGSDVRITCTMCGRDLTLDRCVLEKSVKSTVTQSNEKV